MSGKMQPPAAAFLPQITRMNTDNISEFKINSLAVLRTVFIYSSVFICVICGNLLC